MFDPSVLQAAQQHALEAFPQESIGLVTKGGYVRCKNVSHNPYCNATVDPREVLDHLPYLAVIHSHTLYDPEITTHSNGALWPGEKDMRGQVLTAVPWGICAVTCKDGVKDVSPVFFFGDGIPDIELVGRPFRPGPTGTDGKGDCYALVRDIYRTRLGLSFPEVPRDDAWWLRGGDLYTHGMLNNGFQTLAIGSKPPADLKAGDGAVMTMRPGLPPHHAAVVVEHLGRLRFLHHLHGRVSRHDDMTHFLKMVTHWVRPGALA